MKLFSIFRYNMGVRYKRAYGSSTATVFSIHPTEDPKTWFEVEAAGPTPGERKTIARKAALIAIERGDYSGKKFKAFP